MPRRTLAELAATRPVHAAEQHARYQEMTEEQIDRNAEDDTENPEWTEEDLDKAVFARSVRRAREKAGLSQRVFAKRYHIVLSRLRDWEQARYTPDSVSAAYIAAISYDAKTIEAALSVRRPKKHV